MAQFTGCITRFDIKFVMGYFRADMSRGLSSMEMNNGCRRCFIVATCRLCASHDVLKGAVGTWSSRGLVEISYAK